MKLRQKNPLTVRIADEDRGEVVQDSNLLLSPSPIRLASVSSHLASFCRCVVSCYFRLTIYFQARFSYIFPENHATRSSHQSTSFTTSSTQRTAPMCRPSVTQRSPITTNCRAALQQMTGGNPASVLYRSALTGKLGWVMLVVCQRCVSWFLQFVAFTHRILEGFEHAVEIYLRQLYLASSITAYSCSSYVAIFFRYPCALKYCRNREGEGEHRCGIRTCRKCTTYRFPTKFKNLCLWDEV